MTLFVQLTKGNLSFLGHICYAAKRWSLPTSGFLAWILVPSLNSVELSNRSQRARIIS